MSVSVRDLLMSEKDLIMADKNTVSATNDVIQLYLVLVHVRHCHPFVCVLYHV